MMTEVDLETFAAAHADGGFTIDVREPEEYEAGHVPGALLVPLSALRSESPRLPAGRPVFVICASGNRSATAARLLAGRGVDARSVAGGTSAWQQAGHPVVAGPRQDVA